MSLENARAHLLEYGLDRKIRSFPVSSATVPLAAIALGVEEARIAKTLALHVGDTVMLLVCAGDARLHNQKFKFRFSAKPRMLTSEETEVLIGHRIGGVCPFGIKAGVQVYLDESLRRFTTVYPAAGSPSSAVKLTLDELETAARPLGWVDVCKLPETV